MTLYIRHVNELIIGKPSERCPINSRNKEIKISVLDHYLKNLDRDSKNFLISALKTYPTVQWGNCATPLGTTRRNNIIKIITPIIEKRKIPNDLDYSEIINALGVGTRKHLEYNLVELLQDIGMQEVNGASKY